MNPASGVDPLADLKPIHLPPEPHWWPPAPGWWLLLISIIMVSLAIGWWWTRRKRRLAPYKQADQELKALQANLSPDNLLPALNQLLRRAAAKAHGAQVAAMGIAEWAQFLKDQAPSTLQVDASTWDHLAESAYRKQDIERGGIYIAATQAWLRENLKC